MALADARAIEPDITVLAADPAADQAALARLALWCGRYSPWTAPSGSDGIWLDLTGAAHLRGGEGDLAHELVARLDRQGIKARAAVADTPGAAWAVAREGARPVTVVPPGAVRVALALLPVRALRLPRETIELMERLGLRRIGDLYKLPRPSVVARFGLVAAERLDQALGDLPEPLSPLPPEPIRARHHRFAEPIARPEDLATAIAALAQALCRFLAADGVGARRLASRLLSRRWRGDRAGGRHRAAEPRSPASRAALRRAPRPRRARSRHRGHAPRGAGSRAARRAADGARRRSRPRTSAGRRGARRPRRPDREPPRRGRGDDPPSAGQPSCPSARRSRRRSSPTSRPARPGPPTGRGRSACWRGRSRWRRWRRCPTTRRCCSAGAAACTACARRTDPSASSANGGGHARRKSALRDYYRVEDMDGRRFWLFRAGLHQPRRDPGWFLHGVFA